MLSQEWTLAPKPTGWESAYAYTSLPPSRFGNSSHIWICSGCGVIYAEARSYSSGKLRTFAFHPGLCLDCFALGHRFLIPGTLECLSVIGWKDLPKEVIAYQLKVELDFLSHPNHPHNQQEVSYEP